MATKDTAPISRKAISELLGGELSPTQVKFHEKRWGLDKCRVHLGTRGVLYDRAAIEVILRARGGLD